MNVLQIRVIKVGGSLFDLPDLGTRIQTWVDSQPPAFNLLIAGGGKLVDEIRDQSLDERSAHWQCIDRMNDTAKLLADFLPSFPLYDSFSQYYRSTSQATIFMPARWLRESEPRTPGTRLEENWNVTSDSIAARVAISLDASELVLLKSADPSSESLQQLANAGYVDSFFPNLAGELPPLRIVNLRRTSCFQLRL